MKRILILCVAFALTAMAFSPTVFAGSTKQYKNKHFGYSLRYPKKWWIGQLDKQSGSPAVRFATTRDDVVFTPNENPKGAVVKLRVEDVRVLENTIPSFSKVRTAADWLAWQRSQQNATTTAHLGPFTDEEIAVGRYAAIRTRYLNRPLLTITIVTPAYGYAYMIDYFGTPKAFEKNTPEFQEILSSLAFQEPKGRKSSD